jgi:asparagine synthase (glutamine-hydrolysing)
LSGIYGIYRYDGAPVNPRWLEQMQEAMAYFGPNGGNCRIVGPVGMGHLLMEVNPEDAFESQPVRGQRGLVLSSARLDNRDALLECFSIPASEAPRLSDGHLVSLAFDRWGDEICTHLEGDWALAAWDAKERRLLLARDIFGFGALYYYEGKGFIAFASSLKALLALPGTQKEPDLLRLAEIMVCWYGDPELTGYKGFRSVLGAHALTVTLDGRTHDRRFWSVEGREPVRYRRDNDYVEAFLEHYTRAVKNCLRTEKPIASELSGGRDSGSVVSLAAPILASAGRELTAYTSVPFFPLDGARATRIGNEWDMAHATATMAGANVRHIPVDAKNYGVIASLEYFLDMHDGPGHAASNLYWIQAIKETCEREGFAVLLGGGVGNATVSWSGNGSALLALKQGLPLTALRLLFQGEPNLWLLLKRQVLKPLLTPARRLVRRLRAPGHPWQSYSALNVQMAEQLDIDGRMRGAGYDSTFTWSPLSDMRKDFFSPDYGTSACLWSDSNAWHSVRSLDPTANFSLLEFLLRVPDEQFCRKGQRGYLIQRAFRGRMPEPVLAQKRKGLQAADVGHRIVHELPAFQECLRSFESVPYAQEALDLPLLNRCLARIAAKVDPETTDLAMTTFVRGVGVGLFLRRVAESRS